jgi:hypothetical protein
MVPDDGTVFTDNEILHLDLHLERSNKLYGKVS